MAKLLAGWQVEHLRSPPDCPEYNGSCEVGVGSMKTRSHHKAARRGCPGQWNCDDVEAARRQANETARPWGVNGPTPQDVWESRERITWSQRQAFAREVKKQERQVRQAEGMETEKSQASKAMLMRVVLSKVLIALGLLELTKQTVPGRLRPRRRGPNGKRERRGSPPPAGDLK
jgi:hypothetical protein